MIVADFSQQQLHEQLSHQGITLKITPFTIHLRSKIPSVSEELIKLYGGYNITLGSEFADFHISLEAGSAFRRIFRPQVHFTFDGYRPFKPLPYDQAFAFFEWGLNWCIANHAHQYLIIHAAALEKNGRTLILPGRPGSGKSTLAAALAHSGWRLLTDELAMFSPESGLTVPVPRPVSLKNDSIGIIDQYIPESVISNIVEDTAKGTVAHMRVPDNAVTGCLQKARPAWVVFPKYQGGEPTVVEPMERADAFMKIADNAFNYQLLEEIGFTTLVALIDQCDCSGFSYSNLDEALEYFEQLSEPVVHS